MTKTHFDWRLASGIASIGNFCVLLGVLCSFPLVLRWTGAFGVAEINPGSPLHTRAFVKACLVLIIFLWICFGITLAGIRHRGKITWGELIGTRWSRQTVIRDLGIAGATFLGMGIIGTLSNVVLGPLQRDNAILRSIVAPQNSLEALAFLAAALTAGFVEEFVFRGYIQRQSQALFGNTILASAVQVMLFTQGHFYQGWVRLVPVLLIGALLTVVALGRRSLLPGMIAHGLGDSLVTLSYFAKHL
jgi:membrane protease YdiL (CAAX protease family)